MRDINFSKLIFRYVLVARRQEDAFGVKWHKMTNKQYQVDSGWENY